MLWEFKNNKNAIESAKFPSVYGQGVMSYYQVRNRFSKFCSGNTSLRDEPRQGYTFNFNQDALREMVECNSSKSTQELPLDLNTSHSSLCYHLKRSEKVSKLNVWLPHTLSEKSKEDCISIVTSLHSKQRIYPFLKNIISGDKKWVFYDNIQCKRQWIDQNKSLLSTLKAEFDGRMVMLRI